MTRWTSPLISPEGLNDRRAGIQVTGTVLEIYEHRIGTSKKLAGPSDLRILFPWSHPGPPARTPRPWLGNWSARLGLRKRHSPDEANFDPGLLVGPFHPHKNPSRRCACVVPF